jgi:hypothetical protein
MSSSTYLAGEARMESKIWKKLGTILTSSSNSKEEAMNKIQAEQDRAQAQGALINSQMLNTLQPGSVMSVDPNKLAQLQGATIAATGTYTMKRHPWVSIEVDCVGNGFILRTNDVTLIAKDLEELQQHFTAQVADTLLKWSK